MKGKRDERIWRERERERKMCENKFSGENPEFIVRFFIKILVLILKSKNHLKVVSV